MSEKKKAAVSAGQMSAGRYYLLYTAVFLVTALGMFLPFLLSGRTFIWKVDGRSQYFLHMIHMHRYFRDMLTRLSQGKLSVKLYEFTLGMGDDILGVVRMHPLDLLCIIVPEQHMDALYTFLVLFRLYLAGIGFSIYGRYRGIHDAALVTGSIVYISSGFALLRTTMHPFFGAAMIMLPLMLLGAEKILREGKGLFLALVTFLGFAGSYYFAYMCTIAIGIYFLLRWPEQKNRGISSFFKKGFHVIGAWMLGAMMISWLLLPTFARLFASDRVKVGGGNDIARFYSAGQLLKFLFGFITPDIEAGYNTRLGFIALVIPALIILFVGKIREQLGLKLAVILEALALAVPAAGFIMGAFGNISNRWTFIIAFTLALATARMAEQGPELRKAPRVVMLVTALLYAAACSAAFLAGDRINLTRKYQMLFAAGGLELIVTVTALLLMSQKKVSRPVYDRLLLALSVFCACVSGNVTFHPDAGGEAEEFMTWKDVPAYYENLPQALLSGSNIQEGSVKEAGDFYRVDTAYPGAGSLNASLYYDYNGVSVFNSVMNGSLEQFLLELDNPGLNGNIKITSMDGRGWVENMANVRLYLASEASRILPYGFEKIHSDPETGAALYENTVPLSFAYTYDSFLTREEYDSMGALNRQMAMLESVVLEGSREKIADLTGGKLRETKPEMKSGSEPVTLEAVNEKAEAGLDGIVLHNKGKVQFSLERPEEGECYICLKGLRYTSTAGKGSNGVLTISSGAGKKIVTVRDRRDPYYVPVDDCLVYFGCSDGGSRETVKMSFSGDGFCTVDAVEMQSGSMASYAEDIASRNEGGCPAPEVSANTVEGELEDGKSRFAVFSIPYAKGWKAELDGENVPVLKANRAYLGFMVPEGKHHFKLTYRPPGLALALKLTGAGWLLFLLLLVYESFAAGHRKKCGKEQNKR